MPAAASVVPTAPRPLLERRLALALAVVLALFVVLGLVVRPSGLGDTIDERTLRLLEPLRAADPRAWSGATQFGNPVSYALFGAALMLTAALRGRPRWLLLVPVTMLLSELSAQAIKQLLAQPRPQVASVGRIGEAAWPSGHSTAAMTVALLAILLAPRRLRPTVALLGAGMALAVGIGMVVSGYHYPTDVFGGYLCAAAWVIAAALTVLAWQRRRPAPAPVDRRPLRARHVAGPLLLVLFGGLTAVAVASRDDDGVVATVREHTVAVGVLGALIALALALVLATASLPDGGGDDRAALDDRAGRDDRAAGDDRAAREDRAAGEDRAGPEDPAAWDDRAAGDDRAGPDDRAAGDDRAARDARGRRRRA